MSNLESLQESLQALSENTRNIQRSIGFILDDIEPEFEARQELLKLAHVYGFRGAEEGEIKLAKFVEFLYTLVDKSTEAIPSDSVWAHSLYLEGYREGFNHAFEAMKTEPTS